MDDQVPKDIQVVNEIKRLVEQHFRDRPSLDFYTEKIGLSIKVLNKLLRFHGMPTLATLIQLRSHQEAEHLLRISSMSVKEIAFETGFNDPAYFSRAFTKLKGKPPKYYREHHRR